MAAHFRDRGGLTKAPSHDGCFPYMNTKLPVSVLIPALNEEKNLPDCIASVQWADEVYVIDSGSRDATRQVAEACGAQVVDFHYDGGWPKKKNWAIRNVPIRNEWFLILDADERVNDALRDQMAEAIKSPSINGYYLRWKFVFRGRWMKHGWRHGWMLRLVRKGFGEYEDLGMRSEGGWDNEVHENMVVSGPTATLDAWLTHDSNEGLHHWLNKHNQYSDWNSVRRLRQLQEPRPPLSSALSSDPTTRRRFLKYVYLRLPLKPVLMFAYLYFFKLGILDGKAGLYFCALRAGHELNIEAKMFERETESAPG